MFQMGCKNGKKVTFSELLQEYHVQEPTGSGSIGNPQSGCGSFNPTTITNNSSGSGGSGGTATYFWQYSTSSSSGPWTTISLQTIPLTTHPLYHKLLGIEEDIIVVIHLLQFTLLQLK